MKPYEYKGYIIKRQNDYYIVCKGNVIIERCQTAKEAEHDIDNNFNDD